MTRLSLYPDTASAEGPAELQLETEDAEVIAAALRERGLGYERWAVKPELPADADSAAVLEAYAEEIARVGGYDAVPTRTPETLMPTYRPSPVGVRDAVREALVGAGLVEVVTHALVAPDSIVDLPWLGGGRLVWPKAEIEDAAGRAFLAEHPQAPA